MEFLKKYQGPFIGIAIVVAIILIGFAFTKGGSSDAIANNENLIASSTTDGTAMAFEAFKAGEFEYKLAGVEYTFTPENGLTQVRMQPIGLTRNGSFINVLPFRLGNYSGICTSIEEPRGLVIPQTSRPLAYAECQTVTGTTQFMTSQEGSKIVTRVRTLTTIGATDFTQIQSVDLATLIVY